jgi:membrane associated rhomboid family serine protease
MLEGGGLRYTLNSKVGEANAALCVSCIAFTLFFFMAPLSNIQLLVGDSFSVYNGRYWLLVSNITVHGSGMHLIFNLMWLWYLGNAMEEAMGSFKYMAFVVGAGFVSCGFQLVATVSTGIGISGVICALAGFMWATRKDVPMFGFIMPDKRLRYFIIVLIVMIPLDHFIKGFNIAHHAHFGGLAFGLAVGRASSNTHSRAEHLQGILAVIVLVGFVSTSLVWAPWSKSWREFDHRRQAIKAWEAEKDIYEGVEYLRKKRELEKMDGLIQIVNSKTLPHSKRYAAMAELARYQYLDAARCLVSNLLLGDDGESEFIDLPAPRALIRLGKKGTPAVLDALEGPLQKRNRDIALYVLVSVETASRAEALIRARMTGATQNVKQALTETLESLHKLE